MAKVNKADRDHENSWIDKTQMLIGRTLAVFAASGLSIVGAGSLFGIEVWKSVALAGGLGVATVVEALSRAYLADGRLTTSEINDAFALIDKKKNPS
jgi:hypothetical protein